MKKIILLCSILAVASNSVYAVPEVTVSESHVAGTTNLSFIPNEDVRQGDKLFLSSGGVDKVITFGIKPEVTNIVIRNHIGATINYGIMPASSDGVVYYGSFDLGSIVFDGSNKSKIHLPGVSENFSNYSLVININSLDTIGNCSSNESTEYLSDQGRMFPSKRDITFQGNCNVNNDFTPYMSRPSTNPCLINPISCGYAIGSSVWKAFMRTYCMSIGNSYSYCVKKYP